MSQEKHTVGQPAFWIKKLTNIEASRLDLQPVPYLTTERLARTARQIQRDEGLGYTRALDEAARRAGYHDAKHVRVEAEKAQAANHLKCLQRLALKVAVSNLFTQYQVVDARGIAAPGRLPDLYLDQLVADFCAGKVTDAYMTRTGLGYRNSQMDTVDDVNRSTIHRWRVDYYATLYLEFYTEAQAQAAQRKLDQLPDDEASKLALLFGVAERFMPDDLHEDEAVDAVAALAALETGKYPRGRFYSLFDSSAPMVIEPLANATESEMDEPAERLLEIARDEAADMMRFYRLAFEACPLG